MAQIESDLLWTGDLVPPTMRRALPKLEGEASVVLKQDGRPQIDVYGGHASQLTSAKGPDGKVVEADMAAT